MTFKEIRDYLKENPSNKEELNARAKAEKGRNWTQLTLEDMRTMLSEIVGTEKVVETSDSDNSIIDRINKAKELVDSAWYEIDEDDYNADEWENIENAFVDVQENLEFLQSNLGENYTTSFVSEETEEERLEREEIEREMRELEEGFED